MKKNSIQLTSFCFISLLFVCFAISACSGTKKVYVSTKGNDRNDGTKEAPYASPKAAKEAIAKLKKNGYKGAIELIIAGGTYYLDEPLVWTAEESGTAEQPYVIKAADGQAVVFSAGVPLNLSWERYTGNVWRAAVPKGMVFESLFGNSKNLVRARYPNYDPHVLPFNGYAADALSKARTQKWKNPIGGYVHALHQGRWGGFHYRIVGSDGKGELQLEGGQQNNRPSPMHETYRYVENIFEELDSPGEWFLDNISDSLYYYPVADENIKDMTFVAARLENLISLTGDEKHPVHDIIIEGIHFTHTAPTFMKTTEPLLRSDWTIYRQGAVKLEGSERCQIQYANFDLLGGNAIFVSNYNREVMITGNLIENIGAGGINIVGNPAAVRSPSFRYESFVSPNEMDTIPGPKTNQYPAFCTVSDNLIRNIGQIEKQVAGVQLSMASEITVTHNTIYDVPRAGINIGDGTWGGHVIADNDVFNTVLETSDHGAFNSWGRDRFWHPDRAVMDSIVARHPSWVKLDAVKTTVIRNNRFRCDHGWDIDLDDGSSNYSIYNNLCLNGGLKLREGFYRSVHNNILLNNGFHPHVWFKNSHDVFVRNIAMTAHQPIGLHYWGDTVNYNFFTNEVALKESRAYGVEANGLSTDVQFLEANSGDFRLAQSSIFIAKGFVNFDMDTFGVQSDRLKALTVEPKIPIIVDKKAVPQLRAKQNEWLGAKVKDIETLGEQSAAGLNEKSGVLVTEVPENLPLYKAGLRSGDVIMAIDDYPVRSVAELTEREKNIKRKKKTKIQLWRNQQIKIIELDAEEKHPSSTKTAFITI